MDEPTVNAMSNTLLRLSGRLVRWGFIVVAVVLGATLIVSALNSYRDMQDQVDSLIEAQAANHAREFHRFIRRNIRPRRPPNSQDLSTFLEENEEDGLLYIALFSPRGNLAAEAGTPTIPPQPPHGDGFIVLGDRVQAWSGRHGPFDDKKGPPPRPPRWNGEGKPPPPPGPAPIVIEFTPKIALDLQTRTTRDLGVAIAVALALVLAAGVLWLLSSRAQAVQSHLARQRHLAALGEMSAVLAHEIRNPLAALKGHAQLLAERVQGDQVLERKTARIVDASQRLETLTRSLLDFARISAITRKPVDPVSLLRRCADGCSGPVEIDDAEAPDSWPLGATRIEQVLSNLLDNAAQANTVVESDAAVQARVYEQRGLLVFEVTDHGPGIPAEERERIFEPFVTSRTRGTGLGLAVARRIVELHGGTIEILDAPGGGACFRVSLPPDHTE